MIRIEKFFKYANIVTKDTYNTFKHACGKCTDTITLDDVMIENMRNFYALTRPGTDNLYCPNDIIISKTVPIKDIELNIVDKKYGDTLVRVHIIDQWVDEALSKFTNRTESVCELVGYIELELKHPGDATIVASMPLGIFREDDDISDSISLVMSYMSTKQKHIITQGLLNDKYFADWLSTNFMLALVYWYRVQLMLLNPLTQVCFRTHEQRINDTKPVSNKNQQKQRPIRYIRKLVLNTDEFSNTINPDKKEIKDGNIVRHTMIWRVVGHWRNNKNGTRTFINGYWKGPLRDLKKNQELFETREREIV